MAVAAIQQKYTTRWGDLEEEEEDDHLDVLLQPPVVIGPDKNGLKKVIEYRFDGEGNNVKVTTTKRVRIKRLPKSVIERRAWTKFGDAVKEDAGSRLTVVSTEEIFFDRTRAPGSKAEEPSTSSDSMSMKVKDTPLMVCRTCQKKGDHWTSKCPFKDFVPPTESFVDRPPTANGPSASGGADYGAYRIPSKRLGADKSGAGVMSRRNDENSVRVTNLSEDAREADLHELFGAFGHVSRVYVALDRATGSSRGFGFVNFVHREDAQKAISTLNGHGYDNLILHVDWAAPRPN